MRSPWTPTVVPLRVAGLHLAALSALAVAEPLFDLLSKNPDFLAARALIGWQVVALGLALVLVPPFVALAVEALVGVASRPLRAWLHLLLLGFFVALIAIQALKDIAPDAADAVLIAVAALLGVAAAACYARATALRSFVTVLSPAPAIFLAIFLFFSPVSDLTFASGSADTANVRSHVPFGSDGRPPGLYGIGPHPELIGRAIAELPRAPVSATINGPDGYSSVHLQSDFVPAQLSGTIKNSGDQPNRDLAVALNGRIVAVGQSFRLTRGDPEQFSIMLPDGAFREGSNRIERDNKRTVRQVQIVRAFGRNTGFRGSALLSREPPPLGYCREGTTNPPTSPATMDEHVAEGPMAS